MPAHKRTSSEIRASIDANRAEFATSLDTLRREVVRVTDWRSQVVAHRREAIVATAVVGFVLGGGLVALGGLFTRRRRR